MSISPITGLCEPMGADKISVGTLGYIRARNRQRQYDLVIKELKQSGITQADLARRLGKAPEIVSRLLARPGNWESDTFSDLLFAISGAVALYFSDHPFSRQPHVSVNVGQALSFNAQYILTNQIMVGVTAGIATGGTTTATTISSFPVSAGVIPWPPLAFPNAPMQNVAA
jgi:hypothetical protein